MKLFKDGQYWEFTFQCSRFSSGAEYDPTGTPTWRVYECDTDSGVNDTVVATGSCVERDAGNTVGYWHARGEITAAGGYETGKTYEVRVSAVVDGVSGSEVVGRFGVISANVWDSLIGGTDYLDTNQIQVQGYTLPSFTVVSDAGNTALTFKTSRTESTDNFWKTPQLITFISGALAGQTRMLAGQGYNGTTKFLTVESGFTGTPGDGDIGIFINQ